MIDPQPKQLPCEVCGKDGTTRLCGVHGLEFLTWGPMKHLLASGMGNDPTLQDALGLATDMCCDQFVILAKRRQPRATRICEVP